jgi:hypothetical protein
MNQIAVYVLVFVLALAAPASAGAQWISHPTSGIPRTSEGKPNLTAPAPRTSDGKPDLSGIWAPAPLAIARTPLTVGPNLTDYMPAGAVIPMQPWAQALFNQRSASLGAGRPSERCLPHGIPDAMLPPTPFKMIQTPGLTLLLYEEFNHFRQIFTDGRPLPPAIQPAWLGYSVGKWEGDTFAVDTSGFNDQTWLDDWGRPHTEAMHTIERFRRRDVGHMEMEVTIDDPKAYTKPWSATVRFNLVPDTELIENMCDNERDHAHIVGK